MLMMALKNTGLVAACIQELISSGLAMFSMPSIIFGLDRMPMKAES